MIRKTLTILSLIGLLLSVVEFRSAASKGSA